MKILINVVVGLFSWLVNLVLVSFCIVSSGACCAQEKVSGSLETFYQEVSDLEYIYRKLNLETPSNLFFPAVNSKVEKLPESVVTELSKMAPDVIAKYLHIGNRFQVSSIVAYLTRFPRETRMSIYDNALKILKEPGSEDEKEIYYHIDNEVIWATLEVYRKEFLHELIESDIEKSVAEGSNKGTTDKK